MIKNHKVKTKIKKIKDYLGNSNKGFGSVAFFLGFSFLISCFFVVVIVLGVPNVLKASKNLYNFLFVSQNEKIVLKNAAQEKSFFKDLSQDSKYYEATQYLYSKKIITGFSDGLIYLNTPIQRSELTKIILLAQSKYPTLLSYHDCFKDVKQDWYSPYVCYAKDRAWLNGTTNVYFKPKENVTKAEAVKTLVEAFSLKGSNKVWKNFADIADNSLDSKYVKIALDNNILEENPASEFLNPETFIQRGEIFLMLYKVLKVA